MKSLFPSRFREVTRLEIWLTAALALWTGLAAASFLWNRGQVSRNTLEAALIEARVAFEKDIVYRHWNTLQGGVYVPVTPENQPNPHLADNPDRDLVSTTGKRLTLMNPAYMTRQVNELGTRMLGIRGHITSLNPIRPGNAPDPWERKALGEFARGVREVHAVEIVEGAEYMRYMQSMITEEGCLKCHARQGYRAGQVRGGLSVSVPMAPLRVIERRHLVRLGLAHAGLWLAGLLGILLSGRGLVRGLRQRQRAAEKIARYARDLEKASGFKELFIDIMRHDLLNPATVIQSYGMYLEEGATDPRVKEMAENITRANGRLIEMIQSASKLSRLSETEHLECSACDLGRLIREGIRDIECPLQVEGPPAGDYPVFANPIAGDVFANLLSNAVKYAAAGGRVVISIRDGGKDWIATVADSGPGIPDADKERVFTRFERLQKEGVKGTGLGLAIARRIVDLHGGRIWVEDNPAGGAVFCVSLPKHAGGS